MNNYMLAGAGAIVLSVIASDIMGLGKEHPPTVATCSQILLNDFRDHVQMEKDLRTAMAESQSQDFLTDMCKDDPKKCAPVQKGGSATTK